MSKLISNVILFFFFVLISLIIILSTIGIETSKFNNFISKKINQANKNINLELYTIKFKLDIKEISLFLETQKPEINYRDIIIPAKNIRVYMDFISIIKSKPKIKKINLILNQLELNQLKKISTKLKPSNFTSFVNNKIKQGKINTELEIYFDKYNLLDNFIAKGSVLNFKAEIVNDINLEKTNFDFFADKSDVLIKNIFSETGTIKILDGDLKLKLSPEISIETNFQTNLKYNNKFKNFKNLIKDFNYTNYIDNLETNLNNNFSISLDETYKVKNYNYKGTGTITKGNLNFKEPLINYLYGEKIKNLSLNDSKIKIDLNPQKKNLYISGKYSLNKGNLLPFNIESLTNEDLLKLKLNADYDKPIKFEYINYEKPKKKVANLSLNLNKKKENILIKQINVKEGKNLISVEGLKINNDKFLSFKKISINTSKEGKKNNNFSVLYGSKITINGTHYDANNLPKFFNKKKGKNIFSHINKDIEIDLDSVITPQSKKLKKFKLIGKIENGKFIKISSKGDFGNNNYLDITMKKNKNSKKKYLEIYSDLNRPFLTEYTFFKGLSGGNLLYTAIIDGDNLSSKIKIENFKVINAPGVVKLLSLSDLGGLADLAEGEGLSFDVLEIKMEKNKDFLKINEILALGPSVSVLMEGYQNPTVTSLRGTLIPAKTLNKLISKIPLIGNIVIPKEVGEGLFGISFKMKGPPGNIKTTINPLRTITPRFIQKIVDKRKQSK